MISIYRFESVIGVGFSIALKSEEEKVFANQANSWHLFRCRKIRYETEMNSFSRRKIKGAWYALQKNLKASSVHIQVEQEYIFFTSFF